MRFFFSTLFSLSVVAGVFAQNGFVHTPVGDSGISLDLPEAGLDYDSISENGWKLHFIYALYKGNERPLRLGAFVRQPEAGRQRQPGDEVDLTALMDAMKGLFFTVESRGYSEETLPAYPGVLVLSDRWLSEEPSEFTGEQVTYEVKGLDRKGTFVLLFAELPSDAQDQTALDAFFKSVRL